MHSRIYELSKEPIPADDRFDEYSVPEWFCVDIADYVDCIDERQRAGELEWLASRIGTSCKMDPDSETLTFASEVKESFFKARYDAFKELAAQLAATPFEEFIGKAADDKLGMNMYRFKQSYDDKFGFYVYDKDTSELVTLDSWVRTIDTSCSYYVGGIIDYHF